MKTKNESAITVKQRDERLTKLQRKLEQAISAKAPSANATFAEAYEQIEMAMKKGLAQKDIIELVNETYDLKLHAASFRTLLKTERDSRTANGQRAVCHTCGHNLAPIAHPDREIHSTDSAAEISLQEVA